MLPVAVFALPFHRWAGTSSVYYATELSCPGRCSQKLSDIRCWLATTNPLAYWVEQHVAGNGEITHVPVQRIYFQITQVDAMTYKRLMWTCRLVDEVVWVKTTTNRRLAKSHGYYLQHAKEVMRRISTLSSSTWSLSKLGSEGTNFDIAKYHSCEGPFILAGCFKDLAIPHTGNPLITSRAAVTPTKFFIALCCDFG